MTERIKYRIDQFRAVNAHEKSLMVQIAIANELHNIAQTLKEIHNLKR